MHTVKIYGAGSIGNHLAHAARRLGWQVTVCDVSQAALDRMRTDIYPARYKHWDPDIRLCLNDQAPAGGFDLIIVGTPPGHHLALGLAALREEPQAVLLEKPLCPPTLELAQEFYAAAQASRAKVFVGYDHVAGRAAQAAEAWLRQGRIGPVQTLDVEFREHWGGIFKAHPWLDGPADTYLGYWQRGGGASGEHSHAANLWQHFAHLAGAGRVVEVDAMLTYVNDGRVNYDSLCLAHLRTEGGLAGRVAQDVVTQPHRKRARLQGTDGAIEWVNGYNPEGDAVLFLRPGAAAEVQLLPKTRPDDFIEELKHIEAHASGGAAGSGLALERGLDTMLVVAAMHRSEAEKRRVRLDYAAGYSLAALRV